MRRRGFGIYSLIWKVASQDQARRRLAQLGLRTEEAAVVPGDFAIDPADMFGAQHEFLETALILRDRPKSDTRATMRVQSAKGDVANGIPSADNCKTERCRTGFRVTFATTLSWPSPTIRSILTSSSVAGGLDD